MDPDEKKISHIKVACIYEWVQFTKKTLDRANIDVLFDTR